MSSKFKRNDVLLHRDSSWKIADILGSRIVIVESNKYSYWYSTNIMKSNENMLRDDVKRIDREYVSQDEYLSICSEMNYVFGWSIEECFDYSFRQMRDKLSNWKETKDRINTTIEFNQKFNRYGVSEETPKSLKDSIKDLERVLNDMKNIIGM